MEKTLEIEMEEGGLKSHERAIISNRVCESILPVTIIRTDGKERLIYMTEGYTPIYSCRFSSLGQMFDTIRSFLKALSDAENHILSPSRISSHPAEVFIDRRIGAAGLIFRDDAADGAPGVSQRLLPILEGWKGQSHIVGAPGAMEELSRQIIERQPDTAEILKLVEALELKWNRIYPATGESNQESVM